MDVIEKDGFLTIGLMDTIKEHELFVKMPRLYERFFSFSQFQNKTIYEVCLEKRQNQYTEFIGVLKEKETPLTDGMVEVTIPKARYLYYQYIGDSVGIYQAYVDMYDYALKERLPLDDSEFKIEIKKDDGYDLHIRLDN